MASEILVLRCMPKIRLRGGSVDLDLHVLSLKAVPVPHYELMCEAIDADVGGSGACVLEWIRRVESCEVDFADVDGNAWVMNITREKVWFESLYSQGVGGEVSFAQYKLAVETYLKFLSDPERKPIEVEFPEA